MNIKFLNHSTFIESLGTQFHFNNVPDEVWEKLKIRDVIDGLVKAQIKDTPLHYDLLLKVMLTHTDEPLVYESTPEVKDTSVVLVDNFSFTFTSRLWIVDAAGNGYLQIHCDIAPAAEKEEPVKPLSNFYKVTGIVCTDQEGGIGYKGDIPWTVKGDLLHFQSETKGKICVVGATTFEGLDQSPMKPHDRLFYVVGSRYKDLTKCTSRLPAKFFATMSELLEAVTSESTDGVRTELMVIGGGQVYDYFSTVGLFTHMWVSTVDAIYECDVRLPYLTIRSMGRFEIIDRIPVFKRKGDTDKLVSNTAVLYRFSTV